VSINYVDQSQRANHYTMLSPSMMMTMMIRAVPNTRVARAYSSSINLELYFWASVLDNFL